MRTIGFILVFMILASFLYSALPVTTLEEVPSSKTGYLQIINQTDAQLSITWKDDENSAFVIEANRSKIFGFYMSSSINGTKSTPVTYTCKGIGLNSMTYTDFIEVNQTTTRTINKSQNHGFLKVINNTNAPVTFTWASDNTSIIIEANQSQIFDFNMMQFNIKMNKISATYTCTGSEIKTETFTDVIRQGKPTERTLMKYQQK